MWVLFASKYRTVSVSYIYQSWLPQKPLLSYYTLYVFPVSYISGNVDSSYYSADSVSTSFVNVTLECSPLRPFNICVGEVHDQGCDNRFASAACPGRIMFVPIEITT